ncbi:transmembrane protease serine 9-like [Amphibalanus amphitrite]|uniref:transmembrane protease serine 9-like n=1 Tax=Amphibalanus amphitrite TaxID=1232801 RepID=UPI001C910E05|nr:transmembrane protease serine 9-like [Amphibalanus amphitrite]
MPPRGITAPARASQTTSTTSEKPDLVELTYQWRRIPGTAPNSTCCGIVDHRSNGTGTVNGTIEGHDHYPWMAALVDASGEHWGGTPFCGGALINDRYILTATHCVNWWPSPQWGQVILGKRETFRSSETELRLNVLRIILHPEFYANILHNDIALLELETPLDLPVGDNFIAPICMPQLRRKYYNDEAQMVGWGLHGFKANPASEESRPPVLRSVPMRTMRIGRCSYRIIKTTGKIFVVTPSTVCAEAIDTAAGACWGDSGSPLTVADQDEPLRRILLGLAIWTVRPCHTPSPDVFVKIPKYLDWIITNTENANYC